MEKKKITSSELRSRFVKLLNDILDSGTEEFNEIDVVNAFAIEYCMAMLTGLNATSAQALAHFSEIWDMCQGIAEKHCGYERVDSIRLQKDETEQLLSLNKGELN